MSYIYACVYPVRESLALVAPITIPSNIEAQISGTNEKTLSLTALFYHKPS